MNKQTFIVIAGNRQQYLDFISRLGALDIHDFINAEFASKIAGARANAVIQVGTAHERKDYDEVMKLAVSRIF